MALFYDPKTKKPQVWIMGLFIVIPIVIIIVSLNVGKSIAKKKKENEKKESAQEIFNKF